MAWADKLKKKLDQKKQVAQIAKDLKVEQSLLRPKASDLWIPEKIILHHSFTKDSETVSWGAIRNYHVKEMGWSDIGYHAGIENLRGQIETLIGRSWTRPGAHTKGQNSKSLGLCFVGNYDDIEPNSEMWQAGLNLVRLWQKLYNITKGEIYGHRSFSPKTCPGKKFDVTEFIRQL